MEDKEIILSKVVEDGEKNDVSVKEALPTKPSSNFKNNGFKTKKCKVIAYDKESKFLDVYFDNYGIRIKNVDEIVGDFIDVKYKGEIGKSNFKFKL